MRCTDTILFYSKGKKWTFNKDDVRIAYKGGAPHGGKKWTTDEESLEDWRKRKSKEGKIPENWWTIPKVGSSKEGLGYPTQKPIALYERIIKASSNSDDLVLDPFVGCGTTIEAARKNNRRGHRYRHPAVRPAVDKPASISTKRISANACIWRASGL